MISATLALALLPGLGFQEPAASAPEPDAKQYPEVPKTMSAEEAKAALTQMLDFMLEEQHEDGSFAQPVNSHLSEIGFAWQTYYAWQLGAHGLATLALRRAPESPRTNAALEKAVDWLCQTRMPVRGANWDVDGTWGTLYGFSALSEIARDVRFKEEPWASKVKKRAMEFFADLESRQTPDGGWAYYDDPPFTKRPTWATSFCTALVLPPLHHAKTELGWPIPDHVIERAEECVRRCALPNGAYAYDYRPTQRGWGGESINQINGSLGRIQVCNWALYERGVKVVTLDKLREGLEQFFERHQYLDMARLRPIPHEGWFANAGYFYFFAHYYAGRVIELLPEEEREGWHAKMRPHIIKTMTKEGSMSDFLTSGYMVIASTACGALALEAGLPVEKID